MAAQLMARKGRFDRWLLWKMERATSSLPVPLSPVISTVASVAVTCPISLNTDCMASLRPMIPDS